MVVGVSTIIGAGVAFNAYKFVRKIIDNTPPKKFVNFSISGFMSHQNLLFLGGGKLANWRTCGFFQ